MEDSSGGTGWLCANCQTVCSLERCPTCSGIRVKIKGPDEADTRSKFLLQRLAASPSPAPKRTKVEIHSPPTAKLKAEEIEDDEITMNLVTPVLNLDDTEYASSSSLSRPVNPLAGMLFAASSPLPVTKGALDPQTPTTRKRLSNLSLDSPKLQKFPKPVT